VDDATSKVTTSSGNDKTDDDPISMYPASDSRAGANLTFQGYDDGFDDSVHDDAFSADDTLGNGEYKNQVNTVLTGPTGAEFLPQQSAGSSNFDFGEKADDFATESSTNNDFEYSLSDTSLNSGDDFSVGDSERSGDDFQSIIDGISSSIMKYSPSNQTSSNLTSTDESLINNNGSINYPIESSNLTYTAPVSISLLLLRQNLLSFSFRKSIFQCSFFFFHYKQPKFKTKIFNSHLRQVNHRQLISPVSLSLLQWFNQRMYRVIHRQGYQ
jgi:hypothetical protein